MKLPENIWNSRAIRQRLWQEANFDIDTGGPSKPQYYVLAPQGDSLRGEVILRNYTPSFVDVDPHEIQIQFARDLKEQLRNVHHDGIWLVGFTHPPASGHAVRIDGDNAWDRMFMIWLDEDADAQFTVESDLPFVDMLQAGAEYYEGLCEEAWQKYEEAYGKRAMKGDFALTEDQKTKAALSTL